MWWALQLDPSGFSSPYGAWSQLFCLCSFLSLCHALSLRLSIMSSVEGYFSHLYPLPATRPECPVPPVVKGWHSGTAQLPHSMGSEQGWGHLRANLGLGVFWFIPPLLVVAYLPPTSFIERIFFGLSGVGLAWVQCGVDDGTHRLEGVRTENSAGRIPVRNHLYSPYSRTDVV